MDLEKQILIAKGTIKHIPGIRKLLRRPRTGGTNESLYCYSIWFRHLHYWSKFNRKIPEAVAELGPGDSPGTGFAALLSGVGQVYYLDVISYWSTERNLRIFDELVHLFRRKAIIPDNSVYPRVKPKISIYDFPSEIITDSHLAENLSEERLNEIRKEIMNIDNPNNTHIKVKIPWHEADVIDPGVIDLIYSQAVLECIDELDDTYIAMCRWLKPGGMMSHTIDFKSHGLTKEWNGHYRFNKFEWNLVKGGKSFLVNRQPLSKYLELHSKYNFEILIEETVKLENKIDINSLSKEFRNMSHDDLTTSGVYILSRKGAECDKNKSEG